MRVAFIGSGLQTRRRAPIVVQSPDDELVEVVGTESSPPKGLLEQLGCRWGSDWRRTVERKDVDAIVVCTPPHIHAEISIAALQVGQACPMRKAAVPDIGGGARHGGGRARGETRA